ncbi:HAD family hydrolase [Roseateles amylovorans]|uniref:HAD family hydrolase n=1 Tax=Roseateles amylovorans TaxID=2978473 RepID=A0ABY6B6H5_9BURK|nr:HAD family hydrolase [Roseateles amylovorans]UXH80524.1 HAD family hydrolase [Roseateles amylovorans]
MSKQDRSGTGRPAVFIDEESALLIAPPEFADRTPRLRPHAQAALFALAAHGYSLVLLSSQAGSRLARWSAGEVALHQQQLLGLFQEDGESGVTDVLSCPHLPGLAGKPACDCQLPRAGLLFEAARRHDLDLDRCWLIAGGKRTRRAARTAGCRSVVMGSGRHADTNDLMQAAKKILRKHDPVQGMVSA